MEKANKSLTDSLQKGHDMICQDGKLLACKCSSLDINISEKDLETNCILFEPSQAYCLKKHVVSFIWAICRSIVPPDLLGTHSNWRTLRRNISRFVGLRRFEKYSLRQCLHKLKTSMFTVLSNRHALRNLNETKVQSTDKVTMFTVNSAIHTVNHKIVHYWIFWFFSHLVVPLVQANFYVTESEHGKQDLFYYRKSIWEMVMNKAIRHLEDQNYHSLTAASVRNIANKRSFGFSKVRLLPKENGVRVLANLKASSRIPVTESSLKVKPYQSLGKVYLDQKHVKYDYFKSVNSVLRDLHAVLRGLQMKEPDKLGSSVFDYNDVYRKICPFLSALKNGSVNMPDIFIVVSDVSKAFDSINQDKLLNVVKDVTQNDEYLVKKSHQVVCAKNSLWVHQNLILANEDDGIGSNICTSSNRSLHGILVNQGWSRNIRKEELFFYLNEHLKHNVLQLDKNFYLQNVGIPQGSVLSSLLCSFYYGHLETNVIFPFLRKSEESGTEVVSGRSSGYNASSVSKAEDIPSPSKCLLLRLIDDFIFISTSKKQAASFFSRLQRGFQEYNCYMNKGKFGLNFDVDQISGCESNRMYIGEDGISFIRWSGLFINCCTLEVQADYTRYLKTHVSSSLTVYWQGKPGQHLKTRLCNYLRPKCHPIFYDSNINSAAVVRLNIYQAFLLCAMKFHCYVRDLSNIHQLDIKWYIVSIERSIRYMYKLIKKRMHFVEFDSTFRPIFQVERGEFEWLGLVAYTRILKRKQSRHKKLLSLLKAKLIAHEAKTTSSAMKYAVDDSHSSVFWKIRY
ncbi:RNA-directed DNA polymerase [Bertholletia excelsa]